MLQKGCYLSCRCLKDRQAVLRNGRSHSKFTYELLSISCKRTIRWQCLYQIKDGSFLPDLLFLLIKIKQYLAAVLPPTTWSRPNTFPNNVILTWTRARFPAKIKTEHLEILLRCCPGNHCPEERNSMSLARKQFSLTTLTFSWRSADTVLLIDKENRPLDPPIHRLGKTNRVIVRFGWANRVGHFTH